MSESPNPFASPATPDPVVTASAISSNDLEGDCPELPLEFKTPFATKLILVQLGVITGTICVCMLISCFFWLPVAGVSDATHQLTSICFAVFSGIAAIGCLLSLVCTVRVNVTGIQMRDLGKREYLFSNIRSWHPHPATGTVYISLFNNPKYTAVSNWAMSKENSQILALVLQHKIGSAAG